MRERKIEVSVWATWLSWTAFPALVRISFRHGRYYLRFAEADRTGWVIAWLLQKIGVVESEALCIPFTRHGERVDDPNSAEFRIQAAINEFTDHVFTTYSVQLKSTSCPDPRIRPSQVLANLRKEMGRITYDLLAFLELARFHHNTEGPPATRLVILSPLAVLANSAPPGWAGTNVEFVCQWSPQESVLLWLVRSAVKCITEAMRWPRQRVAAPASVAVVAAWGLDRLARLNDLFWWWESGIPANRVVLFFDRSNFPASREVVAFAQRLGIRCIVLNRLAVGDSSHLLWRAAPGLMVSLRRLGRKLRQVGRSVYRGAVGQWSACRVLQMLYHAEQLEDFLEDFNIRAVFHYQETQLDHVSIACEAAGAARIGYHWSNHHWPVAYQVCLHQVYFAWGLHQVRIIDAVGSCIDHILLSGCIALCEYPGSNFQGGLNQSDADVYVPGSTRSLTLFDTTLPCEELYEFFLKMVLDDSRWSLLIKPKGLKGPPWDWQELPRLRALYERVLASGRVHVLNPRISPAHAAAAADFSVGMDLNSAVVLAALGGRRAIHLDRVRLHASPLSDWAYFYKAGPDRLVFDDPAKLWESLNQFYDQSGSVSELGIANESLLKEIDPFRDGLAGQRIGEYVRWYLENLDGGLERDQALLGADIQYMKKWGAGAVVKNLLCISGSGERSGMAVV